MRPRSTAPALAVLLAVFLATLPAAWGQQAASTPRTREELGEAVRELEPRYREWVESVLGLITRAELEYFLDLEQDYRRDAFMEAFWEPRDPDPGTPQNELRRRWEEYRRSGGGLPYGDPRFVAYLLNGPPGRYSLPDGQPVSICYSRARELEIWFYGGSERTPRRFVLIFFKRSQTTPYELYRQGGSLRAVQRSGGLPTTDIRLLCADDLLRFGLLEISRIGNYEALLDEVMSPPLPSPEWLATFTASTTELPSGAETFDVTTEISFPERNQSRTGMRVLVKVPLDEAPGQRFDGRLFHNFQMNGEVIRDGDLFESFRYRFEGPTPEGARSVPLGFTRYLRPGPATLRVLVEDTFSGRFAQVVREVEVPSPEGLPSAARPVTDLLEPREGAEPTLRLLDPPGELQTGMVRFSARTSGELDEVTFYLDEEPVLTKRSPPYSVELNLGDAPEPHKVRVVGFVGGEEVATDQIWLNQGARRFRVSLVEPRPGGIYPGSLTARVEVQTPDGTPPERVELWVDQEQVAVLEEPPYSRSLRLPTREAAVVRAVAYLADGAAAEDAVLINAAADFTEAIEVQLVELHPLVLDASGMPVRGLEETDFRVLEDGVPQEIQRFESTADAPVHAALLIDRSASMQEHLDTVTGAAGDFAADALGSSEDRVAVLSFAADTSIDQEFTADLARVERALAGLLAFGSTALWDGAVQGLNYFHGVRGHKALVVFSDGRDQSSRMSFEQAVETARQTAVTVHFIGLVEGFPERDTRRALEQLTRETGGRTFFLDTIENLGAVYASIFEDLRSRYLVAYQSTSDEPADEFREVQVDVARRGVEVLVRSGYYP